MGIDQAHGRARDAALAEISDAVCRMGSLMLSSGTGSYRVKGAMGRVAAALGVEQLEAQVSLNEIVVTTRAHGAFRTQVVEVPVPVVNADRIRQLLRVSLRAAPGWTAPDLHRELDDVEAHRHRYPAFVMIAGAAGACAAFAFLNHGRWQECLAAGLAAAIGKGVQLLMHHRVRINQLASVALVSTIACLAYVLLAQGMQLFLASSQLHEAAFTSAILFLVPGFPLITAALDLARFDFTSGMSRLLFAGSVTFSAALGAWLIAWLFHLVPSETPPLGLPLSVMVVLWAITSFVGVFGFAVTFNTPPGIAVAAAAIGAVANVGRLLALDLGGNALLCAAVATLVTGLLAGRASQLLLAPRIILSVPAVLIMVPGASTYRALVAMINADPLNALINGTASIAVVIALATGLTVARMLTDPAWIVANPTWTAMPHTRAQRILLARDAGRTASSARGHDEAAAGDTPT